MIAAAHKNVAQPDEIYEVWPENWQSFIAFRAMHSQWRVVPTFSGVVYQGLEYRSIETVLLGKRVKRKDYPQVIEDLQIMQDAALPIMNKR